MHNGFHVISHRVGWGLLARDIDDRRTLARTVLDIGQRYELLVFAAPDTHMHCVVHCDRRRAGRFARAVEAALTVVMDYPDGFAPAAIRPVENPGHRTHLRDYVLGQFDHHGVQADPLREASNLLDLLGARLTGAHTRAPVRRHIPRTTRGHLLRHAGLESLPDTIASEFIPQAIAVASADVTALKTRRARDAGIHLLRRRGLSTPNIATLIGTSPRTARRVLESAPDGDALVAVERAAALLLATAQTGA